jgi:hypothetical protein
MLPVLDLPGLTTVVSAMLMLLVWGSANIFMPRASLLN